MQGSIIQMAVLTIWGNAGLSGLPGYAAERLNTHRAFSYCEWVRFFDVGPGGKALQDHPVAATPGKWIGLLRHENVRRLHLHYLTQDDDDHQLVAFVGGGGRWLIEAVKETVSDYWESHWQIGNQQHPDNNIWWVSHERIARGASHRQIGNVTMGEVHDSLARTLTDIAAFARLHGETGFAHSFEQGLACLSSANPLAGMFYEDICPSGYSDLSAMQLLAAVQKAWVFGGMGSWNDLWFEGQQAMADYQRLSADAYRMMNKALVTAANGDMPDNHAGNVPAESSTGI